MTNLKPGINVPEFQEEMLLLLLVEQLGRPYSRKRPLPVKTRWRAGKALAQLLTLRCFGWGALSVPRKNLGQLLVAAAITACRCSSLFRIGKQKAWGRRPPCGAACKLVSFGCSLCRCAQAHRQTIRQAKRNRHTDRLTLSVLPENACSTIQHSQT